MWHQFQITGRTSERGAEGIFTPRRSLYLCEAHSLFNYHSAIPAESQGSVAMQALALLTFLLSPEWLRRSTYLLTKWIQSGDSDPPFCWHTISPLCIRWVNFVAVIALPNGMLTFLPNLKIFVNSLSSGTEMNKKIISLHCLCVLRSCRQSCRHFAGSIIDRLRCVRRKATFSPLRIFLRRTKL